MEVTIRFNSAFRFPGSSGWWQLEQWLQFRALELELEQYAYEYEQQHRVAVCGPRPSEG